MKICRLAIILSDQTIGLTLAARLTENANISVLILEAGEEKPDDPLISECESNLSNKHRFEGNSGYRSIRGHFWTKGVRLVFNDGTAKHQP